MIVRLGQDDMDIEDTKDSDRRAFLDAFAAERVGITVLNAVYDALCTEIGLDAVKSLTPETSLLDLGIDVPGGADLEDLVDLIFKDRRSLLFGQPTRVVRTVRDLVVGVAAVMK